MASKWCMMCGEMGRGRVVVWGLKLGYGVFLEMEFCVFCVFGESGSGFLIERGDLMVNRFFKGEHGFCRFFNADSESERFVL